MTHTNTQPQHSYCSFVIRDSANDVIDNLFSMHICICINVNAWYIGIIEYIHPYTSLKL